MGDMLKSLLTAAALACWAILAAAQTASQSQKFQEAIDAMETRGDCPLAIRLFEEAARGPDRNLAAHALFYAGRCFEKLGKQEARKFYERVVAEFPDQSTAAGEARARLARLVPPDQAARPPMVGRRLWTGRDVDISGAVSADGRYLSYTDWEANWLAIRELATGRKRLLVKNPPDGGSADFSIPSPDGRHVVYRRIGMDGQDVVLAAVDAARGQTTPRVLHRGPEGSLPLGWSPDGRQILCQLTRKDLNNHLVLLSVADGSLRVLKSFDSRYAQAATFSPDGRYIAYDFPPHRDSPERDIFVIGSAGDQGDQQAAETAVVQHPANDSFPAWTPDGQRLLFISDRLGSAGAWVIATAGGKPQGPAELVKATIGNIRPLGFTREGAYYYGSYEDMKDVYIAALDPATGTVSGSVPVDSRLLGSKSAPEWSPDGRFLAYSGRGELTIQNLETGEKRGLRPQLPLWRPRWSPDGRTILVHGSKLDTGPGLYLIDVETGAATLALADHTKGFPRQAAWSPDGRSFFYWYIGESIRLRELATGREQVVYPQPGGDFAVSPDGRRLAVSVARDPEAVLLIVPVDGGPARELLRVPETGAFGMGWTPDGRRILFSRRGNFENRELWQVPVEGGEARSTGLTMWGLAEFRIHPDGRRIAFTGGGRQSEVWVLENFLPVPAGR